jgi:hypothetical protein
MLKEIASSKYYSIIIDPDKNRMYFKPQGFWESPEAVPNYNADLTRATKGLKRGFTILTDLLDMKAIKPEMKIVHENAQKLLVEAGLSKTAELLPESVVMDMQLGKIAGTAGMNRQPFKSKTEAEAWLDK